MYNFYEYVNSSCDVCGHQIHILTMFAIYQMSAFADGYTACELAIQVHFTTGRNLQPVIKSNRVLFGLFDGKRLFLHSMDLYSTQRLLC